MTVDHQLLEQANLGDAAAFERLVEPYRHEIRVHCYRMLGSFHDAEDMLQETLLRAWRRLDSFSGRGTFRSWLYRIATNATLDTIDRRARRLLPSVQLPPLQPGEGDIAGGAENVWLEPFPDALISSENPEAVYSTRESIRLAFLVALQYLPPRQRAVLLLRDVLDLPASETAEMLEMTVSAVNSALHRARVTLKQHNLEAHSVAELDQQHEELLGSYLLAWENHDVVGLTSLMKQDAEFSMPPVSIWFKGRPAIVAFLSAEVFKQSAGSEWILRPLSANAIPGFALYRKAEDEQGYLPFAIQLLGIEEGEIASVTNFLHPELFPAFHLDLKR